LLWVAMLAVGGRFRYPWHNPEAWILTLQAN
jgi:hypothetical protein